MLNFKLSFNNQSVPAQSAKNRWSGPCLLFKKVKLKLQISNFSLQLQLAE
jgi:hypothetical protein